MVEMRKKSKGPLGSGPLTLKLCQYGTVYKRPENCVHSRNSARHKIMHCYLGPIVVHL